MKGVGSPFSPPIRARERENGRPTGDAPVVDLAQDVFVRALEALPSLREPAAFKGWLLTIARRAAIDQRAFRGREQALDDDDTDLLEDDSRRPEDLATLAELTTLVRGTVAGLSGRGAAARRPPPPLRVSPPDPGPAPGVTPGAAPAGLSP